jgi:DNA modification methylase
MKFTGIIVMWKPMLWFVKGTRADKKTFINDLVESEPQKDTHEWQQGIKEAEYYIENLCPEDGKVFDPFCGGGTTAVACCKLHHPRNYITCDINEDSVALARERIINEYGRRNGRSQGSFGQYDEVSSCACTTCVEL